jgi:hypothetical protein
VAQAPFCPLNTSRYFDVAPAMSPNKTASEKTITPSCDLRSKRNSSTPRPQIA